MDASSTQPSNTGSPAKTPAGHGAKRRGALKSNLFTLAFLMSKNLKNGQLFPNLSQNKIEN
jgi:hypothetical protein